MADTAAALRSRPRLLTRIRADYELDLPPCSTTWAPRTCRGYNQHPAVDHRCWTWTGWPHICRCLRCGTSRG